MIAPWTEHTYKDRDAWLDGRRLGIGGSEAAAVIGLDPWTSPAKLYALKLGLIQPDAAMTEAQEMGLLLEPIIRRLYEKRTGRKVIDPEPWSVRRSIAHPFMAYSPDGFVVDESATPVRPGHHVSTGRGLGVFQAKTLNAFKAGEWDDEPPLHNLVQLQHEMSVEGATWGVLAGLIGGQRFRYFEYERHERTIEGLIKHEAEFFERLASKTPPPVDGSAACTDMLRRIHPKEDGQVVDLPAEAVEWDRQRLEADEEVKQWQAKKDEAENKIKAAIGDAAVGMLPGLVSYSWTTQSRKAYQVAAASFRVLRRRTAK